MKKTILAVSSMLMAITALAQFPTTSNRAYFTLSKTEWQQVTGFTDGVVNDSIRGIEIAGIKYQRIDLNSTAFNAQSVGIRADGTDQTARLNAVLAKNYVKELVMDIAGGGAVTVNGTVDFFGKKVTFKNTYFTGSGTLNNLYYAAGDYDRVFDTTNLHINDLSTATGYVSPAHFGAKGDGVSDDTRALYRAFRLSDQTIEFPRGTYYTTDSLLLNWSSSAITPQGSLILSNTTDRPGIIIGTYENTNMVAMRNKDYEIRIERYTQSDWSDSNSIGVKTVNLNYGRIKIASVSKFTIGLKTTGVNAGAAYLSWQLGLFEKNQTHLKVATLSPSSLAWNNQITYTNGWFRNGGENPGKQVYGLWIGNGDYSVTNNIFSESSFEFNRANAIPIVIESGSRNQFLNFRSEGNSDTVVKIFARPNSNGLNYIYAGRDGGTGDMYDYSGSGTNFYTSAERIWFEKSNYTSVVSVDNIAAICSYSGTDSSVNIRYPALFMPRSGYGVAVNTLPGVVLENDYLPFTNQSQYAVTTDYIDASSMKRFVIKQKNVDNNPAGIFIKMYDHKGDILSTTAPKSNLQFNYSSTFGGVWSNSNPVLSEATITVSDSVKFIRVMFSRPASGTAKLKSFKIVAYQNGSPATHNAVNTQQPFNLSPSIPTIGSYKFGQIVLNSNMTDTATRGWICSKPGSFGSLSGVTGTIAKNKSQLIVNDGTKIKIGVFVSIAGVPMLVNNVVGDTVWLEGVASAALTGAVINYATPEFITLSKPGGGAGGGSITLSGDLTGTGTGSVPATVNNNAITYVKIQQALGLSVIGRSANSTGVVDAITAAADGNILYRNGTALVFGKPDLVTSIRTALSGYVKAGANTFTASASVPYADISGVPNVFFKNSSSTGDSLLYMIGDTLAIKRVEVTAGNSIISTRTATLGKLLYDIGLQGDAASPGNNKLYGTNSSGVKGWYDQPAGGGGGSGTVTSVGLQLGSTGSDANVTGSPVTTNGTFILNLPTASAAARGLLSSANWTTFSNKADGARTITINGTSYNLTANRTWNVGTVTSVGLALTSTGNNVSVSGTVSTSGNLTINIPTASSTVRGVLSTADWIAFNAKAANTVNMIAGAGLQGGGTLAANRTFTLGTPSDITSTSVNSASGTTHTHALNNTGVSAGTYTNPVITVDAKGRITSASNGTGIGNGNLANMPGMTIKGNNLSSTGTPKDLAVWEVREMLKIYDGNYVPALTTNPDFAMVEQDDTLRLFNTYSGSLANAQMNNTPLASLTIVYPFYYTRIGDNVHVWGRIKAFTDNTDGFTAKTVNIALPFSTTTTQRGDLYGVCRITKVADGSLQVVEVKPSTGGTQANISFIKAASTQEEYEIVMTFDYTIK